MSARSIERPSVRKCQASSREMVASATPLKAAARSRTQPKNACGRARSAGAAQSSQVTLMLSHSSVEMISRERRAFSRAAPMAPTTEAESSKSQAR